MVTTMRPGAEFECGLPWDSRRPEFPVSGTSVIRRSVVHWMLENGGEMAEIEYHVVDVFSETALAGNPLAVVMDKAGLDRAHMQAIAREFNLSETTFVERRPAAVEQREGVRVRIFTTQEELQFAGHPTLGTRAC